jgi:broad specificity phosphatase PhoE
VIVLVRHGESARNVAKKGNRFFLDDEARKSVQGVTDHLTLGSGGESLADVAPWAYLLLSMLFRERAGQQVLVVTRGGTLRTFQMLLERWTWEEAAGRWAAPLPQSSVTVYEWDPAVGRLMRREFSRVFWSDEAPVEAAGAT